MIDLSKNQRSINTSGAHVDGGDVEALRAQFEQYVNPDGDVNMHWLAAGFYAGTGVQQSWLDFQAGHAAAEAETAAAVAKERERCIGIIESHHIPVGNSAAGEMACEWTYDALKTIRDAIRAGAKEPSDADKT